jgi:hypothetical protein
MSLADEPCHFCDGSGVLRISFWYRLKNLFAFPKEEVCFICSGTGKMGALLEEE